MWLDRLAGGPASTSVSSTPQPVSRSYSPLPRRTSSTLSPYVTSQRAGHSPRSSSLSPRNSSLSPRSSSLSLLFNDSSASLLSTSRRPNGSGLRQSSTTPDVPNSLETLEKLIGQKTIGQSDCGKQTGSVVEGDIELDVDFGGLSLKELAAQPQEPHPPNSRRPRIFDTYKGEKSKFEDLHHSIVACDDVLHSVESNLACFRNDLAAVSSDIESLQSRSTALNRRLDKRREVEKALAPLVEELSLSPEIVSRISSGPMDKAWLKTLSEVDRRARAQKTEVSSNSLHSRASEELGPLLEKLTLKAIERIRDFLVSQIKALRSPHINAHIIQQQSFLKFKELYTFLHMHHATLAEEISLAYMNTMRWYYLNRFSRYDKALGKVKIHVLDKSDTLGHEDTTRMAAMLSSARLAGPPHDAFNLGSRIDLLKAKNQSALPSYLAEEDRGGHYLEVPFRNLNLALMDNATVEYTFMAAFFCPALSLSQVSKNFNYVFEPTFELGRTLSKSLVGESFDVLGILMCIRLNQQFSFELQRRRVPALDGYTNATNMLLWPRLQLVMDRHCDSIRQLTNALPTKPARLAGEQCKLTAAPHMVTQRFGQLLNGFLALSGEAGDDEPVNASLQRLRSEVEAFLNRQSQSYGTDNRKSERFLYNNVSLILTIIGETEGKMAIEQREHFEQLKAVYQDKL